MKFLAKLGGGRIAEGSGFEAGPSGVKLSQIQRAATVVAVGPATNKEDEGGGSIAEQRPGRLYLVHTSRRDRQSSASGDPYYQLRIYLDGDSDEDLDLVQKVAYHLHPTFPEPTQVRTERQTKFEVRTKAWGEFNLWAEVFLRGQDKPLLLERYLNL